MTWYLTILRYRYLKEKPNFEVKIWFLRYQKINFCTICIHKLHKLHVTSRLVQQETPTKQMTVFQVTPHRCRIHRPSDQVENAGSITDAMALPRLEMKWLRKLDDMVSTNETLERKIAFFMAFSDVSSPFLHPEFSPVRLPSPSSAHVPGWRVFRGTSPQVRRFSKKKHTFPWNAFIHHIKPATHRGTKKTTKRNRSHCLCRTWHPSLSYPLLNSTQK